MRPAAPPAEASENDTPLGRGAAMMRAATTLMSARRVLVTGLANATLEAITAACDLAETLGAAVDAGLPESARAAGPKCCAMLKRSVRKERSQVQSVRGRRGL